MDYSCKMAQYVPDYFDKKPYYFMRTLVCFVQRASIILLPAGGILVQTEEKLAGNFGLKLFLIRKQCFG